MKKFTVFVLIILIFFSSCSTSNLTSFFGSNQKNKKDIDIDKSGRGLEIDFKIDDEYVGQRKLIYSLTLKNSGLKTIKLEKDDIKFSSFQTIEGKSVITKKTIDNFYEKLFALDSLILIPNNKISFEGVFTIDEDFFDNLLNEKIDLRVEVKYDYETEFVENLEIEYKTGIYELNSLGRISQAAPIQINNIKLVPTEDEHKYLIQFYFEDLGKSNLDEDLGVEILDFDLNYNTENIDSKCYLLDDELEIIEKNLRNFKIYKKQNSYLECEITGFDKKESFTTQTSGKFNYIYKIEEIESLNLPDKRKSFKDDI